MEYRTLEAGEIIQEMDEVYLPSKDKWVVSGMAGMPVDPNSVGKYRRPNSPMTTEPVNSQSQTQSTETEIKVSVSCLVIYLASHVRSMIATLSSIDSNILRKLDLYIAFYQKLHHQINISIPIIATILPPGTTDDAVSYMMMKTFEFLAQLPKNLELQENEKTILAHMITHFLEHKTLDNFPILNYLILPAKEQAA